MSQMLALRPVPSWPRVQVDATGAVVGPSGRRLKTFLNKHGYPCVTIYESGGKWTQVRVHLLVCEAFSGLRPHPNAQVAHRDGDRLNSAASNLRWATQAENEADKVRHGTRAWGERHGCAILTEAQVIEIRARHAAGETGYRLAKAFGMSQTTISRIVRRLNWRHI